MNIKLKRYYKIRKLIEEQDNIHLEISHQNGIWGEKLARNHFELSFYDDGEIKDISRLKSLLELFKEMINDLIEMKLIEPKLLYLVIFKVIST